MGRPTVTTGDGNSILLFLGDAGGNVRAATQPIAVGGAAYRIAAGDFNGDRNADVIVVSSGDFNKDGKSDAVVTNRQSNDLSVFLGQ